MDESLLLCFSSLVVAVVIDGYTHNSNLRSGDSVPLGTQFILVCQVVGLPYGTPLSYAWTCPSGQCVFSANYPTKISSEHILVVFTTYGGTYTCQVTAAGRQHASGNFTVSVTGMSCTVYMSVVHIQYILHHAHLTVGTFSVHCQSSTLLIMMLNDTIAIMQWPSPYSGGSVVHSGGRLIPHEFPITELQQIATSSGNGLITCHVSSGTPMFYSTTGELQAGGVTQYTVKSMAALMVNTSSIDTFQNRDVYCVDIETNHFYLYLSTINSSESFLISNRWGVGKTKPL